MRFKRNHYYEIVDKTKNKKHISKRTHDGVGTFNQKHS